jgi:hypothetical protein
MMVHLVTRTSLVWLVLRADSFPFVKEYRKLQCTITGATHCLLLLILNLKNNLFSLASDYSSPFITTLASSPLCQHLFIVILLLKVILCSSTPKPSTPKQDDLNLKPMNTQVSAALEKMIKLACKLANHPSILNAISIILNYKWSNDEAKMHTIGCSGNRKGTKSWTSDCQWSMASNLC